MKKIIVLLATTIMSSVAFAELEGNLEHYKISYNENNEEVLSDIGSVYPEDVILYKMVFTNVGDENLENIEIKGLIPDVTDYVENSATIKGLEKVVFSIDSGNTWSKTPMITIVEDGKEVRKPAPISDYNQIKWIIPSFEKNSKKVFEYRVIVNN
jgi:uncharacterized repeat protein (TIGR01451 family)